ncbi:FtsW/RodA/SpoVE family cell cycle protein [Desertibaculum subflavum]|uniref:FtsW/RodA/SpoVE family cell cycle protein n=1 Tax=Desertibaculum subflavum TaxID=2268458 RepID=UPI000E669364
MWLPRTDRSLVGRWWWTIDRVTLFALMMLIVVGFVLTLAASPPVATRLNQDQFHFFRRQLVFLLPALVVVFAVSLAPLAGIRRLALAGLAAAFVLMVMTLFSGQEIKGAHRWLYMLGLSIQPSEFVKPCFAVVAGWLLAEARRGAFWLGYPIAALIWTAIIGVLFLQPDVGMAVVVTAVFGAQLFIAGLPMLLVGAALCLAVLGGAAAYSLLPHVASRVDRFLDPSGGGDNYQIERAMEAFQAGGLFGRGPGDGAVKSILPDAHTDFVFAVAGEEYGFAACLLILALFAFIVFRGLGRVLAESNLFVMLAGTGLITQFGLQAVINMGVNLRLMPTKGMTLPFISYGGSSLLALALGMGMLLALTRRRPRVGEAE